ncbi:glutamine synthetase [Candidatus Woesearchaeota archaeon]|nr:glutamine synthetase [Candidatus Woesearchaeota archaeon]
MQEEFDNKDWNIKNYGFEDIDDLIHTLRNTPEIRFVRFITADMLGERECSFTVPAGEVDKKSLNKGFDASSLYPERIKESDKLASFDPNTARVFPVVYNTKTPGFERKWKELIIFGDIIDPENGEYVYDSRTKLKKTLARAKQVAGADTVNVGPELEFFLFKADDEGNPLIIDDKPVLIDEGGYFKGGKYGIVRKEIQLLMSEMGYRFEYDHHEAAPSQHEVDVHYMNALDMADFMMLYRYAAKRVANAHGLFASFMPKPVIGVNGSGMHVHQSLFSKEGNKIEKNLFYDKDDEHELSETAYQYMAGLMQYVPEITAFLNQWTNSYRRLVPGFEAPVYICWDPQNRSNLIRKPEYEPGHEKAARLELRSADPAANPYLALSMMISAGLKGIEQKLAKPMPSNLDVYHISQEERERLGIKSLPASLEQAVNLAEKSELVRTVVGERFLSDFVRIKRKELAKSKAYSKELLPDDSKLSRYETEQLLPIL